MSQNNLTPPQNIEAEESILSSCFSYQDSAAEASDILSPDDFYRTAHKKIFAVISELAHKNEPIDVVTVTTILKERDQLADIGGGVYLSKLMDAPPSVDIQHHCEIVQGDAVKRQLIESANKIFKDCYSNDSAVEVLDKAQKLVIGLDFDPNTKSIHKINELLVSRIEHLEELSKHTGNITGVPTGIIELDRYTCGLQPSDIILLAARPSMGKTAFALDIARHAAKQGYPGLVFSLEMSKEQLVDRCIAAEGGIDGHLMRSGRLSKEDWIKIHDAAATINNLPIHIDDTGALSLMEIRRRSRRAKKRYGIKWVIIDYLQLATTERAQSRDREVGIISSGIKALAKELNLPYLVLSQLNRMVETRENKRPRLSDLRESGTLEQDADVVLFIYRPAVYRNEEEFDGETELLLAKQRNGPAGKAIKVKFNDKYTTFKNITKFYG